MIENCPSCGDEMWSADTMLYEYQQRRGMCMPCVKLNKAAAKAAAKAKLKDAKLALKAEQLESSLMAKPPRAVADGRLTVATDPGGELSHPED